MSLEKIESIDNFKEFLDTVFIGAMDKRASDIHIEPQKDNLTIRFRIDGDLHTFYEIGAQNKENLLTRIKILAQLKIDESRIPQDGQIVYPLNGDDVDMRVSTFPIIHGEKIVIRILKKDFSLLDINQLGFLQYNLKIIKKALKLKEGLILVAGPTGSGKTTTLYALLNHFNPADHNISTLEDPVEYKLRGINQSHIKSEIGYTFSVGLKTLLRQDPDIILVGEIRDKETAMLAVEASLTGHLVLGTIHANAGIGVVERLVNMGIEPYLVASSLKLILAQRLVKKLCTCSVQKEIEQEKIEFFQKDLGGIWDQVKNNLNLRSPVGCEECVNTGYRGRVGIHEVIPIDSDFARLIVGGLDRRDWDRLMVEKSLISIYQDGLLKTLIGITEDKLVLAYKQ
ncbi:MAG: GspE/PulE family protein [Candidatus Absconditabacteria bacterium]